MELNNSETNGTFPIPNGLEFRTMSATEVVLLVFVLTASFTGTVGNIIVINAILLTKELRTVGNYFILNLAVADIGVSAIVNAFSVIGVLDGEQYFLNRPGLCEFVASFCLTACYCSLLSIGCISFNRFVHICHPELYPRLYTARNGILMIVILWIISFLLEMPNFFGFGGHGYDKKTLSCLWDRTAHYGYNLFFVICGVGIPLVMITACYIKIFLFAYKVKRRIAMLTNKLSAKAGREKLESMKLAKTLFAIFICFCLCWTPYAIIVVSDVHDTFPMELHSFSILLAHINSSLNCILYGVFNKNFRRAYKRILGINKCMAKTQTAQPRTTFMEATTAPSSITAA